jgi:hypothetical protein
MSVNVDTTEAEEEGAPEVCLVIHIIQGIDLLPASGDVSDPFVLIHWGSHELQTDQKPSTVHPSWDATFEVPVKLEEKTESIRFWIYSGGTVQRLLARRRIHAHGALRERHGLPEGAPQVVVHGCRPTQRRRRAHSLGCFSAWPWAA